MLCALIMAGGKGERFWPLSTAEKPKQFLKLLGEETMIQMTVKRLQGLVPIEKIFVVTAKPYFNIVKEQLRELPEKNIIVEPIGRNTAPCIAFSAFIINKYFKDAVIAVLPSDHLIAEEIMFRNILHSAYKFINSHEGAVVTLGMTPDRPETEYGYIQYNDQSLHEEESFRVYKVNRFVEKPNLEAAKKYLIEGNFLWNGGMFIWKTSTILKLTKIYLKSTYEILEEIALSDKDNFKEALEVRYKELESISIDFGIMEKAEDVYVIPSNIGWDDVGTWHSVERVREKDNDNNVCIGDIREINSRNNIIIGNRMPIVVVGLDNVFIVEDGKVIYVVNKDNIKDIKKIKEMVTLK